MQVWLGGNYLFHNKQKTLTTLCGL